MAKLCNGCLYFLLFHDGHFLEKFGDGICILDAICLTQEGLSCDSFVGIEEDE